MSFGHEFPGYHFSVRPVLAAFLLCCCAVAASVTFAGHDNIEVDPALKRYAGQVTGLGAPDAKGDIYSFRAKRIRAETEFAPDELSGWRLTILAGKRFAQVFEVRGNTGDEITVTPVKGPLNGIAVKDVFVVENIPLDSSASQR
jgi:hypothetical protein